jgi:superfamily II DNA helicase RecQ
MAEGGRAAALPYHAGLSDEERHRNQDAFLDEQVDTVVATVAFGMEIDRSDVRFVVHAGAPLSLEHDRQESGRAGRSARDFCLGELETAPDPVTLARKILSAVARVGQRFGAVYVTDVLRGRESEQVLPRGHHRLPAFGALEDASIDEIRGYIDQRVAHGLLQQTAGEYPVLQLTLIRASGAGDCYDMRHLLH